MKNKEISCEPLQNELCFPAYAKETLSGNEKPISSDGEYHFERDVTFLHRAIAM